MSDLMQFIDDRTGLAGSNRLEVLTVGTEGYVPNLQAREFEATLVKLIQGVTDKAA